jgi:hypothetical protein
LITWLDVGSNHYTVDVDTPDDYAALNADRRGQEGGRLSNHKAGHG